MKTNKKVWIKPVVEVQMFVPQDCVAACTSQYLGWKVYGGMLISGNLYHDDDKDGEYDPGFLGFGNEKLTTDTSEYPSGASTNPNSYHTGNPPTNINDGNYYTGYTQQGFIFVERPYNGKIMGNLYKQGNRYFTSYESVKTVNS